ncbi:MAG: hypothetical protein AAGD38_15890 [Acidobacteriota bacterium]
MPDHSVRLVYRGQMYSLYGGTWRGPDPHGVHLLTWITDDLCRRQNPQLGTLEADRWLARQVADQLGDAKVLGEE